MGSPISGTMAKTLLQHIEKKHIKQLLDSENIIFYTRYMNDILLIYNTTQITPDEIQKHVDHLHNNLKLMPTHENKAQISLLDLLITRQTNDLHIDMYRKPTTTDTTINYISNHPMEHKLAAYRCYINGMITLPLKEENQNKECKIILNIARNNIFPYKRIN
jgi:predicted oxidoreductase